MLYDPKKQATIDEEIFHASLMPWQIALLRAADFIREHGWCRGTFEDDHGRVCFLGALQRVALPTVDYHARIHAERFLGINAMGWNDYGNHPDFPSKAFPPPQNAADVVRAMHYIALG